MMAHADHYSPAFSAVKYRQLMKGEIPKEELWKYSSYWYKDFDAMAKKSMLRQLISKWGIMSVDMQQAFVSDSHYIQMDESGGFIQADSPEEPPIEPQNEQPV